MTILLISMFCSRVQRGEDAKALGTFEGRVRKWRKQWLTAGPTREGQRLKFNVWTAMEERSTGHVPRPNMVAVRTSVEAVVGSGVWQGDVAKTGNRVKQWL